MLLVYVDDIIIIGTYMAIIKDLQISLRQSNKGLILDQHKYTLDLIPSTGLLLATPIDTHEVSLKLTMIVVIFFPTRHYTSN